MSKFTPEMTIGEVLAVCPEAEEVLMGFGMHCCGCPMSQAETLQQACEAHELDLTLVLQELESIENVAWEECDCGCCGSTCDCGCCDEECDCDESCDCGCQENK